MLMDPRSVYEVRRLLSRWHQANPIPPRSSPLGVAWRRISFGDPCSYCGGPTETLDHIKPRAESGTSAWHSLTGACAKCNQDKHAQPLLLFVLRKYRREARVQRFNQARLT